MSYDQVGIQSMSPYLNTNWHEVVSILYPLPCYPKYAAELTV